MGVLAVLGMLIINACGAALAQQKPTQHLLLADGLHIDKKPWPQQPAHNARNGVKATPNRRTTPGAVVQTPTATNTPASDITPQPTTTAAIIIPLTTVGAMPYGLPPAVTAEEQQLTQQLFARINADRAARGLPAYAWNPTLAAGARLHSFNMVHCGFNHTCPDGSTPCQRITAEGYVNHSDCGENIGYSGPFPTAWLGVLNIHNSMVNEPPTGWHRIYLFSQTIHSMGIGIYVDQNGYVYFTEDMVS